MRYIIAGSSGQLAKAFIKKFKDLNYDFSAPDEKEFDITDKSKIEKVIPSSTVMRGSTPVVQQGNMDIYQQYAFNEDYYNKLLNHGKLQDAVDYISRYRPVDANKRAIFDADVASLRQQAKYEDNFSEDYDEDINPYDFM